MELEFQDIVMQTREANAIQNPLRALLKPCYRPQLVISIVISIVQQLTGINAIMFYAPQVFSTFGSGRKASLLNTVIIGAGVLACLLALNLHADTLASDMMFGAAICLHGLSLMCSLPGFEVPGRSPKTAFYWMGLL